MKSTKITSSSRRLRAGLLAGCVLAGALAGVAQAQSGSPVGDWDFRLTGAEQGVAFLEFSSDFTLHGWEAVTARQSQFSLDSNPGDSRGGLGNSGRTGGSTNGTTNVTFVFIGYSALSGSWTTNSSGQIIGVMGQNDTNFPEGFSFTGKVRPGGNLVLNAIESPDPSSLDHHVRHVTWNGSPLANAPLGVTPPVQPDLSGTWIAQGSVTGGGTNVSPTQSFTELLTFKSLTGGDPTGFFTDLAASPFASQSYVITGVGPGYTNLGIAFQSSKRRLSVVLQEGDSSSSSNLVLRAVEGPLNTNKFIANPLGGTDQDFDIVRYRMQRNVLD